ncbi:MAG: multidrug ABC transporter permease [Deltaproteobacteria bacterium RBG_13_52_11b]|nr:MAG: multidrug ABC transporter permease [Deltaproteobacteria bacterium RBG_13_52_11b]
MAIPFSYNLRNLWTRRLTTALTVGGMALVVFVFASILMLAEGLQKTLVQTGSYDNVVFLRKGSTSEIVSGMSRDQASVLETLPEVAIGPKGQKLLAKELVVLIALPKKGSGKPSNVIFRGIDENSLILRPQVKLMEGRFPRTGSSEVMVGNSIARRFEGIGINETLCCGMRDWRIVGVFDAGTTGFSSEIWGDVEQFMSAFRRAGYSSVILRLRDSREFDQLKSRVETDPRLTLEAKRETRFYAEQSEMMAKFLRILGSSLTIIFSLGAIIGAMITMYSAVATRTAEIGTLRALGFRRGNILTAFLIESLLLGFFGGLTGLFFASFMQLITVSTMNFQTFSELAFSFTMNFEIVYRGMGFALIMGFVGGLLPAIRASRMRIVDSLRAA